MDDKMITKAGLHDRGWRPAMVRDLLGEPDSTKRNPHYRSGPRMMLYARERVEAVEATYAFRERLAKAQASHGKRSAAARRVADDKREAAREWARKVDIRTDWLRNKREAIRDGVEHWELKREARGEFVSGQDADGATKRRWARNYLRHCCSNYDSEIRRLFGVVGRDEAYNIIRERIDSMIDERFPGLRDDPQT